MKRFRLSVLPAIALIALVATACNDNSKPIFTRVRVTPACGVVPLDVETFAAVSGGNEDPPGLGATNNLEITWKFGDQGTASTSIAYHRYTTPGDYTIVVTATDPDGSTATASVPVTVLADSLVMAPVADPAPGTISAGQTVQLGVTAETCDIDYPAIPGDAVKMTFLWQVAGVDTFTGPTPQVTFATPGEFDVDVAVTYPVLAVTRRAQLHYSVVP